MWSRRRDVRHHPQRHVSELRGGLRQSGSRTLCVAIYGSNESDVGSNPAIDSAAAYRQGKQAAPGNRVEPPAARTWLRIHGQVDSRYHCLFVHRSDLHEHTDEDLSIPMAVHEHDHGHWHGYALEQLQARSYSGTYEAMPNLRRTHSAGSYTLQVLPYQICRIVSDRTARPTWILISGLLGELGQIEHETKRPRPARLARHWLADYRTDVGRRIGGIQHFNVCRATRISIRA